MKLPKYPPPLVLYFTQIPVPPTVVPVTPFEVSEAGGSEGAGHGGAGAGAGLWFLLQLFLFLVLSPPAAATRPPAPVPCPPSMSAIRTFPSTPLALDNSSILTLLEEAKAKLW